MNKRGIGLLIATALAVAGTSAYAQPKKPAEGEAAAGAGAEGDAPAVRAHASPACCRKRRTQLIGRSSNSAILNLASMALDWVG